PAAELSSARGVPPPAPAAPPMPYRYAGKLVQGGHQSVLLAKGDMLFQVNEGETLDGAYRVESIGETQVTLTYLPLAHEERIAVDSSLPVAVSATRPDPAATAGGGQAASATAAPARPAPLLWEGPQQVKLGTRFEVVLRVT